MCKWRLMDVPIKTGLAMQARKIISTNDLISDNMAAEIRNFGIKYNYKNHFCLIF